MNRLSLSILLLALGLFALVFSISCTDPNSYAGALDRTSIEGSTVYAIFVKDAYTGKCFLLHASDDSDLHLVNSSYCKR